MEGRTAFLFLRVLPPGSIAFVFLRVRPFAFLPFTSTLPSTGERRRVPAARGRDRAARRLDSRGEGGPSSGAGLGQLVARGDQHGGRLDQLVWRLDQHGERSPSCGAGLDQLVRRLGPFVRRLDQLGVRFAISRREIVNLARGNRLLARAARVSAAGLPRSGDRRRGRVFRICRRCGRMAKARGDTRRHGLKSGAWGVEVRWRCSGVWGSRSEVRRQCSVLTPAH